MTSRRTFALYGGLLLVPLTLLALFFGWPVVAMIARGFGVGQGSGIDLSGFGQVLMQPRTWRIAGQTVGMASIASAVSLALGVPAAFVLYKLRFPGQRILRALAVTPFVLPTVAVGVAFRSLLRENGPFGFLGLDQSVTAVIAAMVFFNMGLVARTVGATWASLSPHDEAARTLGASPWRALWTVTLPQLGPSITAAGGLVFLFCSTSFGIVQTLGRPGYGTLESEIYVQTTTFLNLHTAAVLSILQICVVALAMVVSRALTKRTESTLRLSLDTTRSATRADGWAIGFVVLTIAGLIVAPLASLVVGSLRRDGQWTVHYYRVLGKTGEGYSGGATVADALDHSVRIALDASLIALFIGVPLALVLSRRVASLAGQRALGLLDAVVLLPLGISSVTVGFGFLTTWGQVGWMNSALIVPIAQAIVATPLVVRSLVPVLRGIDPRLREAAATLGASPMRSFLTIDLPFMVRGLSLAFGFAFAISLGEFGATSFLASPNYQTLPVLIARLLGRPGADNYGMALAGTVILVVLTTAIMMTAEALKASNPGRGASRAGNVRARAIGQAELARWARQKVQVDDD